MNLEKAAGYAKSSIDGLVLVHVGLHKTGTTWLQQRIFKALNGAEIEFCGDLKTIYREFVVPEAKDFSITRVQNVFADFMRTAQEAGRLPVISAESLAGRPFHAKYHRSILARRIAAVFPNARILLTIREQNAIIRSMYGQYIRFGYTSNIKQFLQEPSKESSFTPILDKQFYNYARLIQEYREIFLRDRICIMPFERLIADPAWALNSIEKFTGFELPGAILGAKTHKVSNPALSVLAYNTVRQLNRFISQDARWQRTNGSFNPNAVGYWVDRFTPRFLRKSMEKRLREIIDAEISDFYRRSNREASETIGTDLGQFGYAV